MNPQPAHLEQAFQAGPGHPGGTPGPIGLALEFIIQRALRAVVADLLQDFGGQTHHNLGGDAEDLFHPLAMAGEIRPILHQAEAGHLIPVIDQIAILIQQLIQHAGAIIPHPGLQHQIRIAPHHIDGIELDRSHPVQIALDSPLPLPAAGGIQSLEGQGSAPGSGQGYRDGGGRLRIHHRLLVLLKFEGQIL